MGNRRLPIARQLRPQKAGHHSIFFPVVEHMQRIVRGQETGGRARDAVVIGRRNCQEMDLIRRDQGTGRDRRTGAGWRLDVILDPPNQRLQQCPHRPGVRIGVRLLLAEDGQPQRKWCRGMLVEASM